MKQKIISQTHIILFLLFTFLVMYALYAVFEATAQADNVKVPQFKGVSTNEKTKLEKFINIVKSGGGHVKIDTIANQDKNEWTRITDQEPEPGYPVIKGDTVTIKVAWNPDLLTKKGNAKQEGKEKTEETEYIEVPDVIEYDETKARDKIEEKGFKVLIADKPTTNNTLNRKVVSTEPKHGEKKPKGSEVVITVYKYDGIVEVPQVIRQTKEEAEKNLQQAGLSINKTRVQDTRDVQWFEKVIRTDPQAGTEVKRGSKVTLYIGVERKAFPWGWVAGIVVFLFIILVIIGIWLIYDRLERLETRVHKRLKTEPPGDEKGNAQVRIGAELMKQSDVIKEIVIELNRFQDELTAVKRTLNTIKQDLVVRQEVIKHYAQKWTPDEEEAESSTPEERMLRIYNENQEDFERRYHPVVVRMTNSDKAQVSAVSQNVTPEFEEDNTGIFWIIEEHLTYYILPRPGGTKFEIPIIMACFDIEQIESQQNKYSIKKLEKCAVCSKTEKGWILNNKGQLKIEK